MSIAGPIVQHMKLQIRVNPKRNAVELKVSISSNYYLLCCCSSCHVFFASFLVCIIASPPLFFLSVSVSSSLFILFLLVSSPAQRQSMQVLFRKQPTLCAPLCWVSTCEMRLHCCALTTSSSTHSKSKMVRAETEAAEGSVDGINLPVSLWLCFVSLFLFSFFLLLALSSYFFLYLPLSCVIDSLEIKRWGELEHEQQREDGQMKEE